MDGRAERRGWGKSWKSHLRGSKRLSPTTSCTYTDAQRSFGGLFGGWLQFARALTNEGRIRCHLAAFALQESEFARANVTKGVCIQIGRSASQNFRLFGLLSLMQGMLTTYTRRRRVSCWALPLQFSCTCREEDQSVLQRVLNQGPTVVLEKQRVAGGCVPPQLCVLNNTSWHITDSHAERQLPLTHTRSIVWSLQEPWRVPCSGAAPRYCDSGIAPACDAMSLAKPQRRGQTSARHARPSESNHPELRLSMPWAEPSAA